MDIPVNMQLKSPLISLIVLNWNGEELLRECIESLQKTQYQPIEIIVVDNASTDSSMEIIKSYSGVKIIQNKSNLGYAQGNNIGIAVAQGEYVCCLNNDITVTPEWLNAPSNAFNKYTQVGIVSCRQMSFYQKDQIDTLFSHLTGHLLLGRTEHQRLCKDTRYPEMGIVLGANGASAIYRKELLKQLGGFEKDFFAYHEECDLHMRAFYAGWDCLYVPQSVVYHKGSVTFNKVKPQFYYYHERNRIWFIFRNIPGCFILQKIHIVIFREIRTLINLVFLKRMAKVYFRARIDGLSKVKMFATIRRENMKGYKKRKETLKRLMAEKIIFPEKCASTLKSLQQ